MKQPIISVTREDCKWSFTRGSGAGGQKRNKTSSAVHCLHPPSGAHGYSEAGRSQLQNRQDAFAKMARSEKFQKWVRLECSRRLGKLAVLEDEVENQLRSGNIRVEIRQDGIWRVVDDLPEVEDNQLE